MLTRPLRFALVLFAAMTAAPAAQAFPDLIRHGYGNCVSCHVSPSGGGILTEYGRELSREVIATWSTEKEPQFLNGAVDLPKWLKVGGDIRFVQTRVENKAMKDGRWIPMQADVEVAVGEPWLTFVGTAGREEVKNAKGEKIGKFISRRHYLLSQYGEHTYLRAGKFMRPFGINIPEHVAFVKRGLGFDQGSETYNAEASWLGESLNLVGAGIFGRPDDHEKDELVERGFTGTVSYLLASKYKLGYSVFHGKHDERVRDIHGLWAILAFTERAYLMSEWDNVRTKTEGAPALYGVNAYNKAGYEIVQGFELNLVYEMLKQSVAQSKPTQLAYGPGFRFIPRPHIEVSGLYQKVQSPTVSQDWTDSAWLMLHYYL